jgi:hypothetical protein
MATIVKTPAGNWKAIIRITGHPLTTKTFRIKRDATNWARTTEDEIVRGIYVPRNKSEKTTILKALDRYLKEITPTKKPTTQKFENNRSKVIRKYLGSYTLASLSAEYIANYRDQRLSSGLSPDSVRLELALVIYTLSPLKNGEWVCKSTQY